MQMFHAKMVRIGEGAITNPNDLYLSVLMHDDLFEDRSRVVIANFSGFMDRLRSKRTLYEAAKQLYHGMALNIIEFDDLIEIGKFLISKKDEPDFFQLGFAPAPVVSQDVAMGGAGDAVVVPNVPAGFVIPDESPEEKLERLKQVREAAELAEVEAVVKANEIEEEAKKASNELASAKNLLLSANASLINAKSTLQAAKESLGAAKDGPSHHALGMTQVLMKGAEAVVEAAKATVKTAEEAVDKTKAAFLEANESLEEARDLSHACQGGYLAALEKHTAKRRKM
jgi:hypothetical protein